MLDVNHLYCERNQGLLFDALSFSLMPGTVLQIKGPNGAGKTTLLRILCGLFSEFEGEVVWDLEKHPLYLGHKPAVKDSLTVAENLNWLCELQQCIPGSDQIDKALSEVGLRAYKDVLAGQLSEGQRKRVSLARLYLIDSPVWLLDEPFSAIDVEGISKLEDRMRGYVDSGGSIILTSHQAVDIGHDVGEIHLSGAPSCS